VSPFTKGAVKKAPRIDYLATSYDDLGMRATRLLAYDATEISAILRGHLLVERAIGALIAQKMTKPERFFRSQRISFETKVDLASALGVLPDTHVGAAKALNNIRNSYSHDEEHKLSLGELNSLKIKWTPAQNKAFAVVCSKGIEEAAKTAVLFLNWSFLKLLPQRKQPPNNRRSRRAADPER